MKATTVDVRLGDEDRTLRFDAGAIEDYERATTIRLDDGTLVRGSIANGIPVSFWELSRFIWACDKAYCESVGKPPLPKEEVRDRLGEDGAMARLHGDLQKLVGENTPDAEDLDEDEEEEGSDGPGDPSKAGGGSATPTPTPSSSSESPSEPSGD